MISVESLYESSFSVSNSAMASSNAYNEIGTRLVFGCSNSGVRIRPLKQSGEKEKERVKVRRTRHRFNREWAIVFNPAANPNKSQTELGPQKTRESS